MTKASVKLCTPVGQLTALQSIALEKIYEITMNIWFAAEKLGQMGIFFIFVYVNFFWKIFLFEF